MPIRIAGFTYPLLLVFIVIIAISSIVTTRLVSTQIKREKELELIFRASAIRNAIKNFYYAEQPNRYPGNLEELLKDPRSVHRIWLREIYTDPFAAKTDNPDELTWNLIVSEEGFLIGISSKSAEKPLKTSGLPVFVELDESKEGYTSWQFIFRPTPLQETPFLEQL